MVITNIHYHCFFFVISKILIQLKNRNTNNTNSKCDKWQSELNVMAKTTFVMNIYNYQYCSDTLKLIWIEFCSIEIPVGVYLLKSSTQTVGFFQIVNSVQIFTTSIGWLRAVITKTVWSENYFVKLNDKLFKSIIG